MQASWSGLWKESRRFFAPAWFITLALIAVYFAFAPVMLQRQVANQRSAGLGSVAGSPEFWAQTRILNAISGRGTSATYGRGLAQPMHAQYAMLAAPAPPADAADSADAQAEDRKLLRNATMDLVVQSPATVAEKVRQLAEGAGGFLVSSRINGQDEGQNAEVVIRVPADRFEGVRAEIRKLALRVDGDQIETQDVTRDYVDREARLRNLRAQEEQYLSILKHAATVKDTLEVSDKLNGVRGQIEQQQAEFEALAKQVETVAITVSLTPEADTEVFGLHWQPLYRLKVSARDGLDGLAGYMGAMTAFAFYLPTVLLWVATILVGAAIIWRILRWSARVLFRGSRFRNSKPAVAESSPS